MSIHQSTQEASGEFPRAASRFDPRRLIVPLIFVPLLYVVIAYVPPIGLHVLVLGAAVLTVREFYQLHFGPAGHGLELALGSALTLALIIAMQFGGHAGAMLALLLLVVLGSRLISGRALNSSLSDSGILSLGVLYVGFTLGHLPLTRALNDGSALIFFLLLVTWLGDTGAYAAGKTLGRHKLAPTISPNKTVEGLIGGLLLAVLGAYAAKLTFLPMMTPVDCLVLGLGLGAVGALGDLVESAMKRSAGVKDAGHLLVGHGGFLDRLDSLLFTAPAFYYYLTYVKGVTAARVLPW